VRPWVAAGAAAAWLSAAAPLAAQRAALRVGGVRLTYADTLSGLAGTVGGELRWQARRWLGSLEASYAQFSGGAWAVQGAASTVASLVSSRRGVLGFLGDAAISSLDDGAWSGTLTGGLAVALVRGAVTATGSAAAGAVRRVDRTGDPVLSTAARVRVERARWAVEGGVSGTVAGPDAFADATLAGRLGTQRAQLWLLTGARAGDLGGSPWIQARGRLGLTAIASLEAWVGTYPRDLTGFVGGSFGSVGLRVEIGRRLASYTGAFAPASGASPPAVTVRRLSPGRVQVTFQVADAESLAIAGEWNGWTPQPLTKEGTDRWRIVLQLTPGAYRFSLVGAGARWFVPPGVPTVPDDFGGTSGLLIVG
jgi:hypothetical protein